MSKTEAPSRELAMARTVESAGENMALVNDSGFFGDWNMACNLKSRIKG